MNTEFYRNFIVIVEEGSLSGASKKLHVAQPALSTQLKKFEDEFGAELFSRTSRHMEITEAGRILYEKAKDIVSLEDETYRQIDSCQNGTVGTLRIGMTQSYPDYWMQDLLMLYQKNFPDVHFLIYESDSPRLVELLRTNQVDLAFVRSTSRMNPDLTEHLVLDEQLCIYARYNNPWISPYESSVDITKLKGVPLSVSRGFLDIVSYILKKSGVNPDLMSIATSRSMTLMWARAGTAVGLLPYHESQIKDGENGFVRRLSSEDETLREELCSVRCLCSYQDRKLSGVAEEFVRFCRDYQ